MKVVGFEEKHYSFDDGRSTSGYRFYLEDSRPGVTGVATESVFVSMAKLGTYLPAVGDNVSINYNRFGKVASLTCF